MIYFIGSIIIFAVLAIAGLYAIAAGSMYQPGRDPEEEEQE